MRSRRPTSPPPIAPALVLLPALLLGACWRPAAESPIGIDVTASRQHGVAPLAVFFDASATTAPGVERGFHQLEYRWRFGDDNGGDDGSDGRWPVWRPEADAWSVGDRSKNDAAGPLTAHVFERPGVYPVTLEVRDRAGNSARRTLRIAVADAGRTFCNTRTVCFSAGGDFAGCPAGARTVRSDDFAAVAAAAGPNVRLLLRRGERWRADRPVTLAGDGPTVLGAFGAGPPPQIAFDNPGPSLIVDGLSDWRIMDLEFRGAGRKGPLLLARQQARDLLLLRNRAVPGSYHEGLMLPGNTLDQRDQPLHEGLFIVGNELREIGFHDRFHSGGYMMFLAARRLALLGNALADSRNGSHVVRVQHVEQGVIAHNHFADQRPQTSLLTIRSRDLDGDCSAGCGAPTRQVLISDNAFYTRDDRALTLVRPNKPASERHGGRDLIVERNFFARSPSAPDLAQEGVFIDGATAGVTVRDNVIVMERWRGYRAIVSEGRDVDVRDNLCVTPDRTDNAVRCVYFRLGDRLNAHANRLYAPNAGKAQVVSGDVAAEQHDNRLLQRDPLAARDAAGAGLTLARDALRMPVIR